MELYFKRHLAVWSAVVSIHWAHVFVDYGLSHYYYVGIVLNLLPQPPPPATSLCHLVNGLLSEEPWDGASDFLLEVLTAFFLSIQIALIVLPRSMALLLVF